MTIIIALLTIYIIITLLAYFKPQYKLLRAKFEWGFFLDLLYVSTFDFLLCGLIQCKDVMTKFFIN